MHIFRRLITIIVPLIWFIGLKLMKAYPDFWWIILIVALAVAVKGVWFLDFRPKRPWREWLLSKDLWNLLALPIVFMLGNVAVAMIVINDSAYNGLAIFSGLALYLLYWQYYLYLNAPFQYQPYSLENLSWYLSLFCAFCLASAGFGALILLQFNLWIILVALIILFFGLTYSFFWLHKVPWRESRLSILIILLLVVELFIALSFLPIGYYVSGLLLAVAYYLFLGLSQLNATDPGNIKRAAAYLFVAGAVVILILLTAKWQ